MISNITKSAILQLYSSDPGATPAGKEALGMVLNGQMPVAQGTPVADTFPTVMSAEQVAAVTGLCPRSLRTYARRGCIKAAYYAGSSRAHGYLAESVKNFIQEATKGKKQL